MPINKNHKLNILLVEDDQDDALLLKELIADTMKHENPDIDVAINFNDALSANQSKEYDVFILDYRLGKKDGLKLLEALREEGIMSPIIFLTGQGSEEIAVKALKSGAVDYFTKSNLTSTALAKSIRAAVRMQKEIEISLGNNYVTF